MVVLQELGTPNDNIWPGYSDLPYVKKAAYTNNPSSNLRKRFSARLSELGLDLLQKYIHTTVNSTIVTRILTNAFIITILSNPLKVPDLRSDETYNSGGRVEAHLF